MTAFGDILRARLARLDAQSAFGAEFGDDGPEGEGLPGADALSSGLSASTAALGTNVGDPSAAASITHPVLVTPPSADDVIIPGKPVVVPPPSPGPIAPPSPAPGPRPAPPPLPKPPPKPAGASNLPLIGGIVAGAAVIVLGARALKKSR